MNDDNVVIPADAPTWAQRLQTDFNRVFGSLWAAIKEAKSTVVDTSLFLLKGNNLSELTSVPTARTNLGLGSSATRGQDDFVRTDAAQSLTATQQLQARVNINARKWEFPVQSYGAAGNAAADTAAFTAAINAAVANGGGVITGQKQTYVLDQTLPIISTNGIAFEFPHATIQCGAVTTDARGFIAYAGQRSAATTVTASVSKGSKFLNVADTSGMGRGVYIMIYRTNYVPNGANGDPLATYDHYCILRCDSIGAGSVGLETRLPFEIVLSYSNNVWVLTPLTGCGIRGLTFDGSAMTGALNSTVATALGTSPIRPRCIESQYSDGFDIDGVRCENFAFEATEIFASVNPRVGIIKLFHCGNESEPDFRFYQSAFCNFREIHSSQAGSGPHLTQSFQTTGDVLICEDAAGRGLKWTSELRPNIRFIRSTGNFATGLALIGGTQGVYVGRYIGEDNGNGVVGADRSAIWAEDYYNRDNTFGSVSFSRNSGFDVAISPNDRVRILHADQIDVSRLAGKIELNGVWLSHTPALGIGTWLPYTPTFKAAGSGISLFAAINSARWFTHGNRISVELDFTITGLNGAAASDILQVTTPTSNINTTSQGSVSGQAGGSNGFALTGQVKDATSFYVASYSPGTVNTLAVGRRYVVSMTYEEDLMA